MRTLWPLSAALLCLLLPRIAEALELPELAERSKASVVLISVYDGAGKRFATGTGFFISDTGRVVTNVHVIEDARRATVTLAGGQVVGIAGVLAQDASDDLAVLQTTAAGPYPALSLGDSSALLAGDEIVVIGSPMGLAGTLSTGIVAAVRDRSPAGGEPGTGAALLDSWRIQITAPVSHGSSGSPILTRRDGLVVAVAVGINEGGQNLNFGIPVDRLRSLLRGLGEHPVARPFAGADARSPLPQNLGISAAVFALLGLSYGLWQRRGARARAGA